MLRLYSVVDERVWIVDGMMLTGGNRSTRKGKENLSHCYFAHNIFHID